MKPETSGLTPHRDNVRTSRSGARLSLARETLRHLSDRTMPAVAGGRAEMATPLCHTLDFQDGCDSYLPSCLCVPIG